MSNHLAIPRGICQSAPAPFPPAPALYQDQGPEPLESRKPALTRASLPDFLEVLALRLAPSLPGVHNELYLQPSPNKSGKRLPTLGPLPPEVLWLARQLASLVASVLGSFLPLPLWSDLPCFG